MRFSKIRVCGIRIKEDDWHIFGGMVHDVVKGKNGWLSALDISNRLLDQIVVCQLTRRYVRLHLREARP